MTKDVRDRKGDVIMAVMRVHKNKDYTVMSNYHLRDKELSLKAKGLLSFMLSLPPEWDYSVNGLIAVCKEGEASITTTLKELEAHKYLQIVKMRDPSGKFIYEYNIYEKPYGGYPEVDYPEVENQGQINTKEINTNKINTKEINTNNIMHQNGISSTGSKEVRHKNEISSKEVRHKKEIDSKEIRHKYGMYDNVLLTDTQFEKLTTEFPTDWQERIDRMSEYMKSTGKVYKDHLATIRAWARKEKKQNPKNEYDWSFETL